MKLALKEKLFPLLIIFLFLTTYEISSQFNRFGGGLDFNTGIDEQNIKTGNPGFTFRGVYEFKEKFCIIPSLTIYVPKTISGINEKRTTFFGSLNANLTYSMATEEQLLFYALCGVNLSNVYNNYQTDNPDLQNEFEFLPGACIGTGVEMIIEKDLNAFAQVKYVIGKYQQLIIAIGVHYYFKSRRYKTW